MRSADTGSPAWSISADTGGTFTDLLGIEPTTGKPRVFKLLSHGALRSVVSHPPGGAGGIRIVDDWGTGDGFFAGFTLSVLHAPESSYAISGWDASTRTLQIQAGARGLPEVTAGAVVELSSGEEAPVVGARILTATPLGNPFPPLDFRLATTRGTNALLENKGHPFAFFVTDGFTDLLRIGDQRRPDLFALEHRIRQSLAVRTVAVGERIGHDGAVLVPPDLARLETDARECLDRGIRNAAVALVHSYRNPEHERIVARRLAELGFEHVSLSSELAPLIKLLPRAQTAAVDAYLAPILDRFVTGVGRALGDEVPLSLMTSAGGVEPAAGFRAKDSLLSGPAGGVVGAAALAASAGFTRVLTLDMGGTSTDVARFDGDFAYQFRQEVGEATLLSPAMRISTVAAGGGSICAVTPTGLTVGPASAGADPGPACYGNGGPLTLTDVNLLLQRFTAEKVAIPIRDGPARERLAGLKSSMRRAGLTPPDDDRTLLEGLLSIAVERMAAAIRKISVEEGYDPADYALVAFGGAGPQHACAVAASLGIRTVLVGQHAGILSASGLARASVERFAERQVLRPLDEVSIPDQLADIRATARQRLIEDGVAANAIIDRRTMAELRLRGQESPLTVEVTSPSASVLAEEFRAAYHRVFGYSPPHDRTIELVSLRAIAASPARPAGAESFGECQPVESLTIIQSGTSTTVVEQGWTMAEGTRGTLLLRSGASSHSHEAHRPQAIEAELFRSRFRSVVEQMGALLRRTAVSTNVKEREDYSCALLDADGQLAVNAPHIPVHLGALGLCVREVASQFPMAPGDMVVTNHPGFGGSHLPDVTVISPVYDGAGERIAYVANRAHHAEIGGRTPGSMPPDAAHLAEEGVVIPPTYLYRGGTPDYAAIEKLLGTAQFPSRNVVDNLADLKAQAAANLTGVTEIRSLADGHGAETVRHQLGSICERSAAAMAARIGRLELTPGRGAAESLDDGTQIRVAIARTPDGLHVDFTGTAASHSGSLNATPAIVRSAVLYVLRLLVDDDLPLNEGLLRDVSITLPRCFLNPEFDVADPARCPAVVGGNVETSQRLVDTLVKAFGIQACSQGTMNNVIFGNATFGYYETLAGGAGAGPGYHGASALHTHMTNTAITDVEIIESRYPVRIERFAIRAGTGGRGQFTGGDGLVREYRFLEPVTVSLLSQHRNTGPFGWADGAPGAPGHQELVTPTGETIPLPHLAKIDVYPGTVLRVETPGGGGWSVVPERSLQDGASPPSIQSAREG